MAGYCFHTIDSDSHCTIAITFPVAKEVCCSAEYTNVNCGYFAGGSRESWSLLPVNLADALPDLDKLMLARDLGTTRTRYFLLLYALIGLAVVF